MNHPDHRDPRPRGTFLRPWATSLPLTVLLLLTADSGREARAQELADLARAAEGVPVVWQATVTGDFDAELHGSGRIYKLYDATGEYRIAIRLRDHTDQLHQLPERIARNAPGGAGNAALLVDGWFGGEPTGRAVRLDMSPFEQGVRASSRGRLSFETRRQGGAGATFFAMSGDLSVVSYEPEFQARFTAELEGPIRSGQRNPPGRVPQSWNEVRRIGEAQRAERSRARIRGRICQVAAGTEATWGAVECLQVERMRVVETMPQNGRDNVLPERPPLYVTFSERIDPRTLRDNVTLRTLGGDGRSIEVSGSASMVTDSTLRFQPEGELLTGVTYEARVRGGESGVRSRDGAVLEMDHTWRFSTVLDLAAQRTPGELPVRMHVYQTVRDAPLLRGKPGLVRVAIDWQLRPEISAAWQPGEYRMTFTPSYRFRSVYDGHGRRNGSATGIRVRHPDRFDAEDRRLARNTINFFGWRPDAGTGEIRVEVEPFDPYPADAPAPAPFVATRSVSVHPHAPPTLRFAYTVLRVGEWADSVPARELERLHATIPFIETLSTQILPVGGTRGRFFENAVEVPRGARGTVAILSQMMRRIHDEGDFQSGEIIVAFHPDSFRPGGLAVSELSTMSAVREEERERWRSSNHRTVTLEFNPEYPAGAVAMGAVHEFVHTFGFRHDPADARDGSCDHLLIHEALPEITGFRLDQDGETGWQKSTVDGNAESTLPLVPLMWPCVLTDERIWIPTRNYERIDRMIREENLLR